jgi:hypothetical protein
MGWLALLLHCVSLDLARLCRPNRLVWVRNRTTGLPPFNALHVH